MARGFRLRAVAPALLLLGLLAALLPYAKAQDATPVPTPTPVPPTDGTIESLTLIHSTPRSLYYTLTYWSDGLRVTGYLGRPRGRGTHPAIIHNRGGFGGTGALMGGEIVAWVEAGYVAVASQYRGNGGGEGREDFGGQDVHDVTNLITLLKRLPFVDPARIGMFGGSRGGMMAYLALKEQALAGASDLKAVVTVGGIADLFAWDRERGGALAGILWLPLVGVTPAQDAAAFEARSAVFWPELIRAPILLLHGEADRDVSVEQSRALAAALTAAGGSVELVTFPGGDHALTQHAGGVPDALAWFGAFLGGDGVDRSYDAHAAEISAVQTWFLARQQNSD